MEIKAAIFARLVKQPQKKTTVSERPQQETYQ